MRKKEIYAFILSAALATTAGCAPGDLSRYTAQAQRAGEAVFEGKTVPAAGVDAVKSGGSDETEGETGAESVVEAPGVSGTGSETETGSAGEKEAGQSEDAESAAESEDEKEKSTAVEKAEDGAKGGESAAATAGAETSEPDGMFWAASEPAAESAVLAAGANERAKTAMAEKAGLFSGRLAGRDTLGKAEQEALQTVIEQGACEDKTLCLSNSARFEETGTGSFLLLFDSTAFTAWGKVCGDLWYCAGEKAVKLLEDAQFERLQCIQIGERNFLLIQTGKDKKTGAQVYQVKDGRAVGCFADAIDIEQEEDGLCVTYAADCVSYNPLSGEWSGGGEGISCFYQWETDHFERQNVKELTVGQYLAHIQPDENDSEALAWKKRQEEKFFTAYEEGNEYRYSFFAVGDNRIGYRECRIGPSEQGADGSRNAAAEYSYRISKLEGGRLTAQGKTLDKEGYYFADWEQREEELRALSELPAAFLKNQIGRADRTLRAGERIALERILKVWPYGAEDLCFVRQADYDGDGMEESFVAAGRYDGAFGAPVCDLWFVGEEEPALLKENLPVKNALSFSSGGASFFLLEGYETDGAKDRLYGVKAGTAYRYLDFAEKIEIEDNGDLTVWSAQSGNAAPDYYHFLDGEMTEYSVREKDPETLLAYDNGSALYRRLKKIAGAEGGELFCTERDNGLIHVMFSDKNGGVSYETYRVREGELVLTDCGEGGYGIAVREKDF